MKTNSLFTLIVLVVFNSHCLLAQINFNKEAFRFYNEKGKECSYQDLYSSCLKADIILFGEMHNNSIIHWLQLELTKDLLLDSTASLILGAEMFERHQQLQLLEYMQGVTDYKTFKTEAKLWPNFKTDYKPMVDEAIKNEVDFVATNVPRALARSIARVGLDSFSLELNDSVQSLLPPMPIKMDYNAPGYKELMESNFGADHGLNTKFMVEAQAIKDATMAYFILENLEEGQRFLHFNGDYHSKNRGGIYWYLKQYDKKKKVLVISSDEEKDLNFSKEWRGRSDYMLVVPQNMTKTY